MSIRHLAYLACDVCLEICDGSDGDRANDCRKVGKLQGWKRIENSDVCPACQADPEREDLGHRLATYRLWLDQ
jgi:hypothetical protein